MNYLRILFVIVSLIISVNAQKIHSAKKNSVQPSDAQQQMIDEGIKLHDAKKYEEAIELYETVLTQSPDCTFAMYEIGLSYYAKKDAVNALKYLEEGTRYKGPYLPGIIRLIGSIVDDRGEREKALEIYGKAQELAPGDPAIRYDIGLTNARMGKFDEARKSLKKSADLNPGYVNAHYMLAEVFLRSKYRIPALLAAARVLTLESNSPRSKRANEIFNEVFKGGVEKGKKSNEISIFLNLDAPTDEGDFGTIEMTIGLLGAVDETEEKKKLTEEEKFVSKLKSFIAIVTETKLKKNFVKTQYISFLQGIEDKGYTESFAYLLMHQNGNKKAGAYIDANGSKMLEFIEWSKKFQP